MKTGSEQMIDLAEYIHLLIKKGYGWKDIRDSVDSEKIDDAYDIYHSIINIGYDETIDSINKKVEG